MNLLTLRAITKFQRRRAILDHIDLDIPASGILTLLGPSGCGKTSLLRIIAGLDRADTGSILQQGHDISDIPAHRRHFGLMFQDYALFPHLTVGDNITYGLRMQKVDRRRRTARMHDLLALVGLEGFESRNILELSGGEKQRVALARSLAPAPTLLMLDEPLAALDRALRERLGLEIRSILRQVGIPAIMVTHDHSEAFILSDTMAIMQAGRLLQCAQPETLHASPASTDVAGILGLGTIVRSGVLRQALQQELRTDGFFLIRPDASLAPGDDAVVLEGQVQDAIFTGSHYQIRVQVLDTLLTLHALQAWPPGTCTLRLSRSAILSLGQ